MKTLARPSFMGSALWAGLLIALLASSCEEELLGGESSSGKAPTTDFEENDLLGNWELQIDWDNPSLLVEGPSFPRFADPSSLEEVFLESWTQDDGEDFMNQVLSHDVDLRPDGDFTMWVHYQVPGTSLVGSFLFSGRMTDDKAFIDGLGNDHGASGNPDGIVGIWDEDFGFSLTRL